MNILAVDQGTSSTKALVIDGEGAVVGEGIAPVSPQAGPGGAVEQDPHELLRSILDSGRAAIDAAGVEIDAVGLGNQGETVLRWDRASGRPLGPAISWQDRRAEEVTQRLVDHADRLLTLTGLPLDPYFAAPKMTWLRRHGGGDGVVTTVDAWLTHQLTGRFVTDAATASRTMLLDLDAVEWSEEAAALFGMDPGDQPQVVACDAPVGETDAFGTTVPLTGLAVDQQAALFAESCFTAGDAKCTYGTGAFILANAGASPAASSSGLASCVAWTVGDDATTTYCLDGQIYTAGAAVSWLQRVGLLGDASEIDELCGTEPPTPDSPTFVPALAGLGAPFWAPAARGGWSGLSLATTRADLVSAVIWGIAAQVAILARAMGEDLGQPLERLRVDGGLSRSSALLQAQADLLQLPVERYPFADATALGVGAFARLGAGGESSPSEAVGDWSPSVVVEPRMGAQEATERLARFDSAARQRIEARETST